MQQLSPSAFFSLDTFAHAQLFHGAQYVWEPLNHIKEYLETLELGDIEVTIPPGTYLTNPAMISIGAGTVIEPGAYIAGPCVIGRDCQIRHGAYLRGDLVIGDRCIIGHASEAKHSIFLDGAKAAHFAYVGDSILGVDCNLGAGTKCANLRLDNGNVVIQVDGRQFDTGRRKVGAILGDGVQIGCNAVCNPGTLVAPGGHGLPCSPLSGYVKSKRQQHSKLNQN